MLGFRTRSCGDDDGGPQRPKKGVSLGVPAGSKIYIAIRDRFDTYLTAALRKSKVPLVVVSEKDKADYEFSGIPSEHSAVKLVNVKAREVVFAYTITKRDAKHGPQTVAEACAQHMKEAFAGE
jgi:hypothetical protein